MLKHTKFLISGLIGIIVVIPILIYWLIYGSVSNISAEDAIEMLNKNEDKTLLIDVRDSVEYNHEHVEGAYHWPVDEINKLKSMQEIPDEYKNKTLLLICNSGYITTGAVNSLEKLGVNSAINVTGGMQKWAKFGYQFSKQKYSHFIHYNSHKYLSFQATNKFDQFIAFLSAFIVKPLYMILSLLLIWILRKSQHIDLVVLRWGIIFFFIGEFLCMMNYTFFNDESYLSEYLHCVGMAMCFSFSIYALIEGIDQRIIKLNNPDSKCSFVKLCGSCIKYNDVKCKMKSFYQLLLFIFILICFIPLTTDYNLHGYTTKIYGEEYFYAQLKIYQIFENVFCPINAILLFILSLISLKFIKTQIIPFQSQIFFAGGAGLILFGLFRLIILQIFHSNLVWYGFWEEFTEFLFISFILFVLYIYKKTLFGDEIKTFD